MALGLMSILTIVLAFTTIIGAVIILVKKGEYIKNKTIFSAFCVVAIAIAGLIYSSLPSNYAIQRCVACLWAVLAGAANILVRKEKFDLSRYLLLGALVGSMIQFLFF